MLPSYLAHSFFPLDSLKYRLDTRCYLPPLVNLIIPIYFKKLVKKYELGLQK